MSLRSIAGAALAGLAVAALLGSAALVFATLAGAALAALVVVSRRRVFESFDFERTPAQRVIAWGGRLDVTMSFSNAKLLPLVWMRVRDEWPLGLEPRGFALNASAVHANQILSQTISLRWYERVRRHYQVRCLQRGLHRFGPVELEAGDPFGIAGVVRTLPAREEIVVLPRVLDVPGLELLTGRPLVDEPALRSLTTDPTALRGTRPYLPGDALRAVNWRATARTGTLHTNEFDPTTLTAVRLLLDVSVFEHAWLGVDPTRMELLCVVAASLAAASPVAASGSVSPRTRASPVTGGRSTSSLVRGRSTTCSRRSAGCSCFARRLWPRAQRRARRRHRRGRLRARRRGAAGAGARAARAAARRTTGDRGVRRQSQQRGAAVRRRDRAGRLRLEGGRCAPARGLSSCR